MKKSRIIDEDWDFLIILDACRYDYFKKNYKKYFKIGKLEKRKTLATWTLEWAERNFIDITTTSPGLRFWATSVYRIDRMRFKLNFFGVQEKKHDFQVFQDELRKFKYGQVNSLETTSINH